MSAVLEPKLLDAAPRSNDRLCELDRRDVVFYPDTIRRGVNDDGQTPPVIRHPSLNGNVLWANDARNPSNTDITELSCPD